jgi:hypothetical protein
LKLFSPEFAIFSWKRVLAVRATMPEAAVNLNRNSLSYECNVNAAGGCLPVKPIPGEALLS